MANQDILNFYGSKLDIKVDYSELYDYDLSSSNDYDSKVIDLSNLITYPKLVIDSSCLNITPINSVEPFENEINTQIIRDNCDFLINRRTEKGWTLNFVFNKNSYPWVSGSTFYYWGIKDETDSLNYLDNNLSFSFTTDGRIQWKSFKYSGNCDSTSGYTESNYILTGQTPILCSGGTSNDFNVTITFERYKYYTDCDIENAGGWNDLITGWTVTNPYGVVTGDTENYEIVETLNKKWWNERGNRLGILKIYLNGRPIYKIKDWEEVIPSQRSSLNPMVQIWGGGTTGSGGIHVGTSRFDIKKIQYFEEPLNFVNIYHQYMVSIEPSYTINKCFDDCVDSPSFYFNTPLLSEDDENLLLENNDILLY